MFSQVEDAWSTLLESDSHPAVAIAVAVAITVIFSGNVRRVFIVLRSILFIVNDFFYLAGCRSTLLTILTIYSSITPAQ